jgi:hypothetical protein
MHRKGLELIEELYEEFLIDPGMEPVVLTSRLRLAISSVQLFIQRTFLNLERRVHPSTLDADHWQWMKRYRVWEANRKIFLYPENWLEPEFRDDKTHLFQELESALLEGDVSDDLVEAAFFRYVRKLESLARLEIVSTYCEEKPTDPRANTVHVIGRTYSLPHEYFYRKYTRRMWTPWVPITAEIEGDHVVPVVWRQRLHVFWLTFLDKPTAEIGKGSEQAAAGGPIQDMSFNELSAALGDTVPARKEVQIQLNWCEYYQGEWTARESSGFGDPIVVKVDNSFHASDASLHVSKDHSADGEGAVWIHVHFPWAYQGTVSNVHESGDIAARANLMRSNDRIWRSGNVGVLEEAGGFSERPGDLGRMAVDVGAFPRWPLGAFEFAGPVSLALRLANKNVAPAVHAGQAPLDWPYPHERQTRTTLHRERGPFAVDYVTRTVQEDRGPVIPESHTESVLQQLREFSIVPCSNEVEWPAPEFSVLTAPLFYQDEQHVFFVESFLTEVTLDKWEDWVITTTQHGPLHRFDEVFWEIPVWEIVPDPDPLGPLIQFGIERQTDWLTSPNTLIQFDESLIGREGGIEDAFRGGLTTRPDGRGAVRPAEPSAVAAEAAIRGGFNVIGAGGLAAARMRSAPMPRSRVGRVLPQ